MPSSTAIKWLHRLLTLALFLVVLVYALVQQYSGPPYDDELILSKQLNSSSWLYITKYKDGGATVSDVYRYYLAGKLSASPLKELGKIAPFLTAERGDAVVSKIGNLLSVNVTGKVYDFTNSVFYYSDGVAYTPTVDFTARNSQH